MNLSQEQKIIPEKILPKQTVSTSDLINWAQAAGIHPSYIGSLMGCTNHPMPAETHWHLDQAKECLARAQECLSKGDRANSDYWELMVYEAIQKVSLKRGERD